MPKLIGLYSPAPQSGKTTLAEALHGHGYRRVSFADPLREMVGALLHWQGMDAVEATDRLRGARKAEPCPQLAGRSARYALQRLGTEWGRQLMGDSIWVEAALARAHSLMRAGQSVVIDDMRFPNEAAAIRGCGGLLIRITRPGVAPPPDAHASEGSLDSWAFDLDLVNNAASPLAFVLDASAAIARAGG